MKAIFIDHHGVISNNTFYGDYDKFKEDGLLFSKTNLRNIQKLKYHINKTTKGDVCIISSSSLLLSKRESLAKTYNTLHLNYIKIPELNIDKLNEDMMRDSIIKHIINIYNIVDYLIIDDYKELYSKYDIDNRLILTDNTIGFDKKSLYKVKELIKELKW